MEIFFFLQLQLWIFGEKSFRKSFWGRVQLQPRDAIPAGSLICDITYPSALPRDVIGRFGGGIAEKHGD